MTNTENYQIRRPRTLQEIREKELLRKLIGVKTFANRKLDNYYFREDLQDRELGILFYTELVKHTLERLKEINNGITDETLEEPLIDFLWNEKDETQLRFLFGFFLEGYKEAYEASEKTINQCLKEIIRELKLKLD